MKEGRKSSIEVREKEIRDGSELGRVRMIEKGIYRERREVVYFMNG